MRLALGFGGSAETQLFGRVAQSPLTAWIVTAATPIIFALATWSDRGSDYLPLAYTRLFGLPVMAAELCVLLIAIAGDWRPFSTLDQLPRSIQILLGMLVLTALASAAFGAPRPVQALWWTYLSLIHLLFGFAISSLINRSSRAERALLWPAIVAGLCGFDLCLLVFVNSSHSPGFSWEYLGFAVTNVRGLGFYSAVGATCAYALAVQRRGLPKWLYTAASALSIAVACWSGSRGALAAVIVSICATMVLVRSFRTIRSAALALSVFAWGAAASLLQPAPFHLYGIGRIAGSLQSNSLNSATSGRTAMWADAWSAFLKHPFLGYGEGQFGWVAPQPQGAYFHPHNLVLQLLVQWGLIGTAIAFSLAAISVRRSDLFGLERRPDAIPAFMLVTALLVFSLYDGALFHAYPVMMFTVAVAVLLTFPAQGTNGCSTKRPSAAA